MHICELDKRAALTLRRISQSVAPAASWQIRVLDVVTTQRNGRLRCRHKPGTTFKLQVSRLRHATILGNCG
jgi:hypothetical protein